LSSGACQAALKDSPSHKGLVDKVLAGLGKWQSVVAGPKKNILTVVGIGLENLSGIGISIFPGKRQDQVGDMAVDAASAIQSEAQVTSVVGDAANASVVSEDGKVTKPTDQSAIGKFGMTD
jgi:hypothetical protein